MPLWAITLAISISLGLISKRLDWVSVSIILLFAISTYNLQNQKLPLSIRGLFAAAALIMGVGLEGHVFPGFTNLMVIDRDQISKDGIPFTLYLNLDKAVVGLFILGVLHQLISSKDEWLKMFKSAVPCAFLVVLVVVCLSLVFQFVHYEPKIPASLWIWTCTDLMFACVAEEAFFRGFIQKYLSVLLKDKHYGNVIAVVLTAILFGLAHYPGGTKYMILATVAGLGYGWVYARTKRIEASIFTHFALNSTHFFFFTYPALAISVA